MNALGSDIGKINYLGEWISGSHLAAAMVKGLARTVSKNCVKALGTYMLLKGAAMPKRCLARQVMTKGN